MYKKKNTHTHTKTYTHITLNIMQNLAFLCKCMYDVCIQGLQGEQYSGTDGVPV